MQSPIVETALAYIEKDNWRVCNKCNESKPISEFGKRTSAPDGLYKACKTCVNAAGKEWRLANPEKQKQRALRGYSKSAEKVKQRVKEWRAVPENKARKNALERASRKKPSRIESAARYKLTYTVPPEILDARNARRRQQRLSDPAVKEKAKKFREEYYSRPEVIEASKIHRREYFSKQETKERVNRKRREKYASDPLFYCASKIRSITLRTFNKIGKSKNDKTINILGYSADQFRQRIECQFKPGMGWHNKPEWHIDHKKPISAFIKQGVTDVRTINMLCNMQPLWRDENQAKSAKWPLVAANDNRKIDDESGRRSN